MLVSGGMSPREGGVLASEWGECGRKQEATALGVREGIGEKPGREGGGALQAAEFPRQAGFCRERN